MKACDRPTVRSIALLAGVSATTVALALRNARRIPIDTRKRIQAIARAEGYRPDPHVRKLMQHLRTRRDQRGRANICLLIPSPSAPRYFSERLIEGIQSRATTSGYALSILPFENTPVTNASLGRMLRNRGVEGVIFAPLAKPQRLDPSFDCSSLSVVAATSSVLSPRFDAVMPNHYDNMIMACQKLIAVGIKRIGLAISTNHDERVRHRSAGAIAWHMFFRQTETVTPLVASACTAEAIAKWIEREEPEAVIADHDFERLLEPVIVQLSGKRRPKLVSVNWPSPFASVGIDQRETEIGAAAVDVLAGMIERGEKGTPKKPRITMIDGVWRSNLQARNNS